MTTKLLEELDQRRVLLCVGTGGVGKTTVAAALALAAARRGRRVALLTIDPARRLADALGDGELGHEPRELGREARRRLGLDAVGPANPTNSKNPTHSTDPTDPMDRTSQTNPTSSKNPAHRGSLHACTLDSKRTFDQLVERFAPDSETRDRIFDNRLYQHMAEALAGSAEYAAMERVCAIVADDRFDLVVVDTPPAQHTLDFLDAPQRLAEFLESRLVQGLLHPAFAASRFGMRVFEGGVRRLLGLIERVTGLSFLEDLSEFLITIESLAVGFRGRAVELAELLRSPEARFLLVTGPAADRVRSGTRFLDQLEAANVRVSGVIANRVRPWPGAPEEVSLLREDATTEPPVALARALAAAFGPDGPAAATAAIGVAKGYALQVAADAQALEPMRARAREGGLVFIEIPEFSDDVHDLEGLSQIEHALLAHDGAEGGPPEAGNRM
jgi:anion-transporting  ArsA/GET3 family ATPase